MELQLRVYDNLTFPLYKDKTMGAKKLGHYLSWGKETKKSSAVEDGERDKQEKDKVLVFPQCSWVSSHRLFQKSTCVPDLGFPKPPAPHS